MRNRYWTLWSLCNFHTKPFGDNTCAVVDEKAGGIIAYANSEKTADLIVQSLQLLQPTKEK